MLVERKYRSSKAHPVRQVRNLHNPQTNVDTYTHTSTYIYTHANSDAHADTNRHSHCGAYRNRHGRPSHARHCGTGTATHPARAGAARGPGNRRRHTAYPPHPGRHCVQPPATRHADHHPGPCQHLRCKRLHIPDTAAAMTQGESRKTGAPNSSAVPDD